MIDVNRLIELNDRTLDTLRIGFTKSNSNERKYWRSSINKALDTKIDLMKILDANGREVNVNISKYTIDWDRVVSKPQKQTKDALRGIWGGQAVCEEFKIPASRMRIDLINFSMGVVVEVSPKGSHKYNKFFNKNRSNFLRAAKRDIKKAEWCELNGFRYVEIVDEDLKSGKIVEKVIGDEV